MRRTKGAFDASCVQLEEVKVQLLAASEEVVVAKSTHQHEINELIEKHESYTATMDARVSGMETARKAALIDKDQALTQRDAAVAEIDFLKEMIDTEKRSMNCEVDRLKQHIEELQGAHRKEILTLTTDKEEAVKALSANVASLERDIKSLGTDLSSSLEENFRVEALNREARELLNKQDVRFQEMSTALDEANKSLLRAKVNYHVHQYHGNKLNDALSEVKTARDADLASSQLAMDAKDVEVKEMAKELLEASSHAVDLEAQLRQLRKDKEELTNSLKSNIDSNERSFHSVLVKSQHEQDALRTQKEELSLRIAVLEGNLQDQTAGLACASSEVATLRQEVVRLEEVNAEMQRLGEEYVEESECTQATLQGQDGRGHGYYSRAARTDVKYQDTAYRRHRKVERTASRDGSTAPAA